MKKHQTIEDILFTQSGYDNLKKEREELLVERKQTVERLKEARAMGDLSENGYYRAAKSQLRSIANRIALLEGLLKFGKVQKANPGEIGIDTKVTVESNGKEVVFHIVGKYETDPLSKKISHISPIGSALMGKKVGDRVTVAIPSGMVEYTITHIA